MTDMRITGVVLAGGKSSRMGANKALFDYNGTPLIEHMSGILERAGIERVVISGDIDGYDAIPDDETFGGPATAILNLFEKLENTDAVLAVPVDMPLLAPELLEELTAHPDGAWFDGYPLPALIARRGDVALDRRSMRALLEATGARPLDLPEEYEAAMANINTPEDWAEVAGA